MDAVATGAGAVAGVGAGAGAAAGAAAGSAGALKSGSSLIGPLVALMPGAALVAGTSGGGS